MPVKYPPNTPGVCVACARATFLPPEARIDERERIEFREVQRLQVEATAAFIVRPPCISFASSDQQAKTNEVHLILVHVQYSTYLETDHLISDFNSLERHEPVSASDSMSMRMRIE
jgi:hypothetical protein